MAAGFWFVLNINQNPSVFNCTGVFVNSFCLNLMLKPSLKFWAEGDLLATAPYVEKASPKTNGFDRLLTTWWGSCLPRITSHLKPPTAFVGQVQAYAHEFAGMPDVDIRQQASALRPVLLKQGFRQDLVARSFALIREVSHRKLGLRHHPVQLQGGLAMLQGALVEMATGEGKTITALLPAITAALAGLPVHIITVNDYLAERDEAHLRVVFQTLGLRSGIIQHGLSASERRTVYLADIVYVTNKEIVFDYLKDRITLQGHRSRGRIAVKRFFSSQPAEALSPLLLRGLHYAIIDEADSILIDEARTPLIISTNADVQDQAPQYALALELASSCVQPEDFKLNTHTRFIQLTATGKQKLDRLCKDQVGLWRIRRAREELVQQALSATHLFTRDVHYIVQDDKIQIVDEYTGRIMQDRSWEGGLHQMIEMKEGVELTARRETQARITYQRFFSRYRRLSGMSGTALEVAGELLTVFSLRSVPIPTHKPVIRTHEGITLYATSKHKWHAVVDRIKHVTGVACRPVLIGVTSVSDSEHLSALLHQEKMPHAVLNARQDSEEADIIAGAGEPGKITVATNMAGRGTDIRLSPEVKCLGGLHVILTEFHESARIDRQLYGRSGRQGDPGSCESIVALEDAIFQRYASVLATSLKPLSKKTGRLPAVFGHLLRIKAQHAAEREHLSTRRLQVTTDDKLDKTLSFSGIPE